MDRRALPLVATLLLALGQGAPVQAAAARAPAQPKPAAQAPAAPASLAAPVYAPTIADLMNIAVQPRHAKLSAAIKARNWTYAAYEIRELRNAFARIARAVPVYEGKRTDELMVIARDPVDSLEAAIMAGDAKEAANAYAVLTHSCNACHQVLDRGYIAIVAPSASGFPNQDFRPQRAP